MNDTNKYKLRFTTGALTHIGCVRTNNEDNFLVSTDLSTGKWILPQDSQHFFPLEQKGAMLIVADGMGGLDAGEVASKIAVDTVKEFFMPERITDETVQDESHIRACLCEAIVEADRRIKTRSREAYNGKSMGTTIVVAWLLDGCANIAWCGDSRAYRFDTVSGLQQVTKDHSYVQELIDSGRLLPEYAFDHPDNNIITRSLGNPQKKAEPDFVRIVLHEGETLLLCTDGLNAMLRDEEIESLMQKTASRTDTCLKALLSQTLEAGGYDNVTILLCQIAPPEHPENAPAQQETLSTFAEKKKFRKSNPFIWLFGLFSVLLIGGLLWFFLSKEPVSTWKQKIIQWYEQIGK